MKRRVLAFIMFAAIVPGCATDGGTSVGVGFYGDWYYGDDVWYGGGCCVDPPGNIGAHPEHPIVLPPDGVGPPRPDQPIALPPQAEPKSTRPSTTSSSSSMRSAAPRASMSMGGGGRGGRR